MKKVNKMDKFARFRYQPCLPLGADGKRVTASKEHINLSREAATEGMVLLKNINNALPLTKGDKVALFGKATIEYIKGGGGSGDVHCPYIKNIFEGFKDKEKRVRFLFICPLLTFIRNMLKKKVLTFRLKNRLTQPGILLTQWNSAQNVTI